MSTDFNRTLSVTRNHATMQVPIVGSITGADGKTTDGYLREHPLYNKHGKSWEYWGQKYDMANHIVHKIAYAIVMVVSQIKWIVSYQGTEYQRNRESAVDAFKDKPLTQRVVFNLDSQNYKIPSALYAISDDTSHRGSKPAQKAREAVETWTKGVVNSFKDLDNSIEMFTVAHAALANLENSVGFRSLSQSEQEEFIAIAKMAFAKDIVQYIAEGVKVGTFPSFKVYNKLVKAGLIPADVNLFNDLFAPHFKMDDDSRAEVYKILDAISESESEKEADQIKAEDAIIWKNYIDAFQPKQSGSPESFLGVSPLISPRRTPSGMFPARTPMASPAWGSLTPRSPSGIPVHSHREDGRFGDGDTTYNAFFKLADFDIPSHLQQAPARSADRVTSVVHNHASPFDAHDGTATPPLPPKNPQKPGRKVANPVNVSTSQTHPVSLPTPPRSPRVATPNLSRRDSFETPVFDVLTHAKVPIFRIKDTNGNITLVGEPFPDGTPLNTSIAIPNAHDMPKSAETIPATESRRWKITYPQASRSDGSKERAIKKEAYRELKRLSTAYDALSLELDRNCSEYHELLSQLEQNSELNTVRSRLKEHLNLTSVAPEYKDEYDMKTRELQTQLDRCSQSYEAQKESVLQKRKLIEQQRLELDSLYASIDQHLTTVDGRSKVAELTTDAIASMSPNRRAAYSILVATKIILIQDCLRGNLNDQFRLEAQNNLQTNIELYKKLAQPLDVLVEAPAENAWKDGVSELDDIVEELRQLSLEQARKKESGNGRLQDGGSSQPATPVATPRREVPKTPILHKLDIDVKKRSPKLIEAHELARQKRNAQKKMVGLPRTEAS